MRKIEQSIRKAYSHPRVRVVNITPNALLSDSEPPSPSLYDDELGAKRNRHWLNYDEEEWYEDE